MQEHDISTADILPKLLGGQIINQISTFLQQKAVDNKPTNTDHPIKIETSEPCLSPTDSMSSSSALQSPASSSSTGVKRSGSHLDNNEMEFKKIKEETNDDWSEADVSLPPVQLTKPRHMITPDDVFMLVPGRLTLLTSSNKYKVTVGEIQRRLGNPENLNASILGAILRRAKSKNGGRELRTCLEQHGILLPAGKRKSTQVTLFTSMLEGESEQMAKDFDFICNSEFPAAELAKSVVEQQPNKQDIESCRKRREELQIALKVMTELIVSMTTATADSAVQKPMENFQLLTHNFGSAALLTAYGTFNKYVTTQMELLSPKLAAPQAIHPYQFPASLMQDPANLLTLQTLLQICQQKNVI